MAYNHIYTEILREIKSRITTAMTGSGKLTEVKHCIIGDAKQTYEKKDLPLINIVFDGLIESFEAQKNSNRSGDLNLGLIVLYPVTDSNNIYYDDNDTPYTGYFPFVEKLLDVLCSDTDGNIDMRINTTARKSLSVTAEPAQKIEQGIRQLFNLTLRSKDFTINERYEAS